MQDNEVRKADLSKSHSMMHIGQSNQIFSYNLMGVMSFEGYVGENISLKRAVN